MAENKKWSWIKLTPSFFDDYKIKLLQATDNGDSYLVFYIKLLAESASHNGALRYSDEIPYDEKSLAVITNTNIDTVSAAILKLQQLGLLSVFDNKTYFINRLYEHVGTDNSPEAKRKRKERYLSAAKEEKKAQLPNNSNENDFAVRNVSANSTVEYKSNRVIELKSNRIKDNTGKKEPVKKVTKKVYGEFKNVKLSDIEYSKLLELLTNESNVNVWIKRVDEYCESTGKKYKNYYLTIRQWVSKDKENKPEEYKPKVYAPAGF